MKYVFPMTVVVLLAVFSVHSATAQSPALINADVTHLVAMRVSDQTVIAVIHEAKATQFDFSPQAISDLAVSGVLTAVIAAMRQSPSANGLITPEQTPTMFLPQTLAGAEAAAKLVKRSPNDTWRLGPSSGTPVPPAPASMSEGTKAEGTAPTTTTTADERGRHSLCDDDAHARS